MKFFVSIFCVYSTMLREFKDFIQMKRTVVIDKLERYCMNALVDSFIGRQQICRRKTSVMHFIESIAKHCAFICIICIFFFCFFGKTQVSRWTRIVKTLHEVLLFKTCFCFSVNFVLRLLYL